MQYPKQLLAILTGVALFMPVFAFAAPTNTATSTTPVMTAKMKTAVERANKEIDRRIEMLKNLNARVESMQNVTASFKQALAGNIQNQITLFTQLKDKINAGTDEATLKKDIQSMAESYRVFALVIPQSRIAAAADREVTAIMMLKTLGEKLQKLVLEQQNAGKDVSKLLPLLTDMEAKLKSASEKAPAAVTESAKLTPDNGDKAKMAENTKALKAARSNIQAAHKDLVAAQQNAQKIIVGLKALGVSVHASSTSPTGGTQR